MKFTSSNVLDLFLIVKITPMSSVSTLRKLSTDSGNSGFLQVSKAFKLVFNKKIYYKQQSKSTKL